MTPSFNRSTQDQVKKADNYSGSFTTCILKVSSGTGWEKTMMKVLGNMHGVNFKMVENGRIIVSGKVDPTKLLKVFAKAGKTAELLWWQFGECSTNLFLPNQHYQTMNNSHHGYGTIGGYCGGYYDGYGGNNYYQGGYGGNSRLDDLPCPYPVSSPRQKSEQKEPIQCCTIM